MKFTTKYKGKEYSFNDGLEAFVFDCAICNEFDRTHDDNDLYELIYLVYRCWLKDDNDISVDKLTDFLCKRFDDIKDCGCYEILDKFYNDNNEDFEEVE